MSLVLPYEFAGVGLKTPTSRLDANFQAVADWLNTHGGVVGTIAERPAPTSVGAIYIAVDQQDLWYMADGTAWHPVGRAGDSTIDVDPVTGNVRLWGAAVGTGAQSVLALGRITTLPAPRAGVAQLYVADRQGIDGSANWHQTTEDGWTHALDRNVARVALTTPTPVANTIVETSLVSAPVQGGTLVVNGTAPRGIDLALGLDANNSTGATRTLTLRVKFGGQTLITAVLTLTSSGTRRKGALGYRLDPYASNFIIPSEVCFQWEPPPTEALTLANLVVDPTLTQTLEVTAQLSFASASVDVRLWTAQVTVT